MKITMFIINGYSCCISHYKEVDEMNIIKQVFSDGIIYSSEYLKFNRKRVWK